MAEKEMQVIEIHPGSKYMLHFEEKLTSEQVTRFERQLSEWLKDDVPILLAYGCKLVKVKDGQE